MILVKSYDKFIICQVYTGRYAAIGIENYLGSRAMNMTYRSAHATLQTAAQSC